MVCMLHLVKVFYPAVQDEVIIILLIITYLVRIIQMFFMFHVHRLGLLYSDWSGEYKGKSVGVRLTDQQFQHLKGPRRGTQTPCKTGNPIKRGKKVSVLSPGGVCKYSLWQLPIGGIRKPESGSAGKWNGRCPKAKWNCCCCPRSDNTAD